MSEKSYQIVKKDASLSGNQEGVVLQTDVVSASADVKPLTIQYTVNKVLLDGACTAFALHKAALL